MKVGHRMSKAVGVQCRDDPPLRRCACGYASASFDPLDGIFCWGGPIDGPTTSVHRLSECGPPKPEELASGRGMTPERETVGGMFGTAP